jgi:hypothetical protein
MKYEIKIDPNKVKIVGKSAVAVIDDKAKYLEEFRAKRDRYWAKIQAQAKKENNE